MTGRLGDSTVAMSVSVSGVEAGKRSLEQEDGGKAGEGGSGGSKRQRQELADLPTRQYLDQTVVPILLQVGQSAGACSSEARGTSEM